MLMMNKFLNIIKSLIGKRRATDAIIDDKNNRMEVLCEESHRNEVPIVGKKSNQNNQQNHVAWYRVHI